MQVFEKGPASKAVSSLIFVNDQGVVFGDDAQPESTDNRGRHEKLAEAAWAVISHTGTAVCNIVQQRVHLDNRGFHVRPGTMVGSVGGGFLVGVFLGVFFADRAVVWFRRFAE